MRLFHRETAQKTESLNHLRKEAMLHRERESVEAVAEELAGVGSVRILGRAVEGEEKSEREKKVRFYWW